MPAVTPAWMRAPGVHLDEAALLALRDEAHAPDRPRAARRAGVLASRQPGSGMDLREIRAYVPGDDLRRLDPSATARTGRPHVRALNEDRDDVTMMVADFRPAMLWGTAGALRSVRAARHLAGLGWRATRRGGAVGLVVAEGSGARSVAPAPGEAQMAALCRMLAHCHADALAAAQTATQTAAQTADGAPVAGLTEALALAARAPRGAEIRLASLPEGWAGAEEALARLARGRRLEVSVILDPVEIAPPAVPMPVHGRTGQRLARLGVTDLAACLGRLRALGADGHGVVP